MLWAPMKKVPREAFQRNDYWVNPEEKMGRQTPGKKEQVGFQAEDTESARAHRCSMERYYGYCRWLGYLEA